MICADHITDELKRQLGSSNRRFDMEIARAAGEKQKQCGECRRWYFPHEMMTTTPSPKTMSQDIPRRNRIDRFTPAEKAIYDAAQAVEAMPADVRLTNAGIKLTEARTLVADFVDGVPGGESYPRPVPSPFDSCAHAFVTKLADKGYPLNDALEEELGALFEAEYKQGLETATKNVVGYFLNRAEWLRQEVMRGGSCHIEQQQAAGAARDIERDRHMHPETWPYKP